MSLLRQNQRVVYIHAAHILTCLFLLILLPAVATAQEDERSTVRLDGRTLFRVGASADATAPQRAERIESRLNLLLQRPADIAPARVESSGEEGESRIISVAGVPIVTISVEDAQDNLTDIDSLAEQWSGVIDLRMRQSSQPRMSAWGRFRAEVRGAIVTAFSRLQESAITVIPRITAALLVLAFFWLLATAVRLLMRVVFRRIIQDLTIENLIRQIAFYFVWVVGLVLALDALGFTPQTVVTGLGLTSLALGFALKDIISNFVSGLLILTLRPFQLGDQIIVGDTEGSVERIHLRATRIRTYDGRVVLLPNAELFTSRVTNNTAAPVRRGSVRLFLGYNSNLPVAQAAIIAATQSTDGVLADPPVSVRTVELTSADVVLEARFWTDSRRSDYMTTASNVRQSLLLALKEADVPLPEPATRILVPSNPSEWQKALRQPLEQQRSTDAPGEES